MAAEPEGTLVFLDNRITLLLFDVDLVTTEDLKPTLEAIEREFSPVLHCAERMLIPEYAARVEELFAPVLERDPARYEGLRAVFHLARTTHVLPVLLGSDPAAVGAALPRIIAETVPAGADFPEAIGMCVEGPWTVAACDLLGVKDAYDSVKYRIMAQDLDPVIELDVTCVIRGRDCDVSTKILDEDLETGLRQIGAYLTYETVFFASVFAQAGFRGVDTTARTFAFPDPEETPAKPPAPPKPVELAELATLSTYTM